jgi:hypothetical protein
VVVVVLLLLWLCCAQEKEWSVQKICSTHHKPSTKGAIKKERKRKGKEKKRKRKGKKRKRKNILVDSFLLFCSIKKYA